MPTIDGIARAEFPGARGAGSDGRNLRRRIEGCDDARPFYFTWLAIDGSGSVGVRDGQYELYASAIKNNNVFNLGALKCFDLVADPFEEGPGVAISASTCGPLKPLPNTWSTSA